MGKKRNSYLIPLDIRDQTIKGRIIKVDASDRVGIIKNYGLFSLFQQNQKYYSQFNANSIKRVISYVKRAEEAKTEVELNAIIDDLKEDSAIKKFRRVEKSIVNKPLEKKKQLLLIFLQGELSRVNDSGYVNAYKRLIDKWYLHPIYYAPRQISLGLYKVFLTAGSQFLRRLVEYRNLKFYNSKISFFLEKKDIPLFLPIPLATKLKDILTSLKNDPNAKTKRIGPLSDLRFDTTSYFLFISDIKEMPGIEHPKWEGNGYYIITVEDVQIISLDIERKAISRLDVMLHNILKRKVERVVDNYKNIIYSHERYTEFCREFFA